MSWQEMIRGVVAKMAVEQNRGRGGRGELNLDNKKLEKVKILPTFCNKIILIVQNKVYFVSL